MSFRIHGKRRWLRLERASFWALSFCLVFGWSATSCKRTNVAARNSLSAPNENKGQAEEVNAAWYKVPAASLARRRASAEELTAAHDQLPIGTLIRVTHLGNGKSVDVRITDRGIDDPKVKLDLCKEAAERLEMVSEGIARVRIEILSEPSPSPSTSPTA